MITEFTCGIYTATYGLTGAFKWCVQVNKRTIATIDSDGSLIAFSHNTPLLTPDDMTEILVSMNNIKRQYKQLQTT